MAFDEIGCAAARGSISRRIPCSGSKCRINSLLGRIDSLLACVGNLLANCWIRRSFRAGCLHKTAEPAKFPAFFPATREYITPGGRESIRGKTLEGRLGGNGGHARKTRIILSAGGAIRSRDSVVQASTPGSTSTPSLATTRPRFITRLLLGRAATASAIEPAGIATRSAIAPTRIP
jgi:hypothetical protein